MSGSAARVATVAPAVVEARRCIGEKRVQDAKAIVRTNVNGRVANEDIESLIAEESCKHVSMDYGCLAREIVFCRRYGSTVKVTRIDARFRRGVRNGTCNHARTARNISNSHVSLRLSLRMPVFSPPHRNL